MVNGRPSPIETMISLTLKVVAEFGWMLLNVEMLTTMPRKSNILPCGSTDKFLKDIVRDLQSVIGNEARAQQLGNDNDSDDKSLPTEISCY